MPEEGLQAQVDDPGIQIGDDGVAVEETPEVTPAEPQEPREAETPEEHEGERPETEKTAETTPLPKDLSRMLRELKEQRPELAPHVRELNSAYYQRNAYKEVFPNVDDARSAKSTLEALGGEEGIIDLQTLRDDVDKYDQMIAEGNPEVVGAWWDEAKDGLIKLAPVVLQKIEKENPVAFESVTRPFFVKSILQSGLVESMNTVIDFLGQDVNPYAQRELAKIAQWLRGLQTEYQGMSRTPETDPRVQQLETERENLRRAEVQRRDQDIDEKVGRHVYTGITDGLRPLLKGRELSKDAMSDLIMGIGHEIQNALDADKVYQKNLEALRRSGDVSRIVAYSRSKIDSVRQRAITTVFTRRYGNSLPPAKKPVTQKAGSQPQGSTQRSTAGPSAPIPIPSKPSLDKIDFSKDPDQLMFIAGKGYLKDGRFVTWRR